VAANISTYQQQTEGKTMKGVAKTKQPELRIGLNGSGVIIFSLFVFDKETGRVDHIENFKSRSEAYAWCKASKNYDRLNDCTLHIK
jgi:hypothetical protein